MVYIACMCHECIVVYGAPKQAIPALRNCVVTVLMNFQLDPSYFLCLSMYEKFCGDCYVKRTCYHLTVNCHLEFRSIFSYLLLFVFSNISQYIPTKYMLTE